MAKRRNTQSAAPMPPALAMQSPPPDDPFVRRYTARPELSDESCEDLELQQRLQAAYVRQRKYRVLIAENRQSYYVGNQDHPVWRKLAKVMRERGWTDPDGYIAAQFNRLAIPKPHELITEAAFNHYQLHQNSLVPQFVAEWDSEVAALSGAIAKRSLAYPHLTDRQVWEQALCDPTALYTPLFRYCVARSEGLDHAIHRFHTAACNQLATHLKSYVEAWGDKLPKDLIEEATVATAQHV